MFLAKKLEELLNSKNYNLIINSDNIVFLAYLLAEGIKGSLLKDRVFFAIFPEFSQAEEFFQAFKVFSEEKIALYPGVDLLPFKEMLSSSEEEVERIGVLWNLKNYKIIAGDACSFLKKVIPKEILQKEYLYLILGEKVEREKLLLRLLELGYERVGVVREKGGFAVKGSVVDLWSPNYEYPVRIEFFGDQVVAIKHFAPDTQKSFLTLEEVSIIPCKELFLPEDLKILYQRLFGLKEKIEENYLSKVLAQIEQKSFTENPEFLLPIFHERLSFPFEYINSKLCFLLYEPELIETKVEMFWEKIHVNALKAKEKKRLFFEPEEVYLSTQDFFSWFEKGLVIKAGKLLASASLDEKVLEVEVIKRDPLVLNPTERIEVGFRLLKSALEEGDKVWLVTSEPYTPQIILEGLKSRGLENLEGLEFKQGYVRKGFYLKDQKLWVTSEAELFGRGYFRGKSPKQGVKRAKGYFRKFEDLKPGDLVVHRVHGIGKYLGLNILSIDGMEGEFLEIEYEGGDKLYLPVFRLDELYPYVGLTEKPPKLDKLGKKSFLLKKKKIEKELTEVVQELLSLYAERKALKSYSLSFPALAYEEFRATFPYEETPDQKIAIEEVLKDLCSDKPMERLLVGDVGFGKTEVALRAIFVAAYSGKQVAFLVPTTILAEQHYRNFKPRLEPFGIKVGILSRLRSEKEQKQTLKGLVEGEIKVVIGTHRLLSHDVEFKDLGLIVIDEEHKFGVKQKEKLKQLKKNVKVLSLSATPIPRSLQLSLLGVFELSVIESPPEGRKPIKTVMAKFDPEVIKYAIEKELERGGQIFLVNPRIQGLRSLANYVKKLCPEVRLETIHGQMPPDLIEKNLYKFLNKEIDMLVCTPIIGSGIDIPSANTIIINRADMLGVADIYQLRGRVGRSQEAAYAYLLVPSLKNLSEDAQKRFKALMKFTDLGAGFKLALSDLKIRGAGELLGIKQAGHINTVGYELYLELLENTIKALKGEEIEDWEPEVNLKVPAFIPKEYVPESEERLSLYRELVINKTKEDLLEFIEFLKDKYGEMPDPIKNLVKIFLIKLYMKELKIPLLELKGKDLVFLVRKKEILPWFRPLNKEGFSFLTKQDKKGIKVIFKLSDQNPVDLSLKILEKINEILGKTQ
ncbi:transcription-repair coupling factor [Thermodesulfobacterium sp. TA1]|uniref:transcription-repair coupling factor n=1 Tax=Thermodesulfobacterium sp. TA1 TaxID=2234087 RepID=UPI0012323D05|nr:transcription-repair coupling factor [Thermodesulfobacterium sp. TA1]QER42036.1 transcription-repair coupling factor [Thermodesulfobacterium sp. TA1]